MSNHAPTARSLLDSWLTVKLLAQAEPSFTESAIRYHVFNAAPRHTSLGLIPGNGLAPHIRRIGSKVLINHGGFLSWIDGSGDADGSSPSRTNYAPLNPPEKSGKAESSSTDGSRRRL